MRLDGARDAHKPPTTESHMYNTARSTGSQSARLDFEPRPAHVGVSSLIKANVYDAAGNRLARIDDIILDARTGSVRFVVLGLGGFLGIGREQFAVPWHVLTADIDDRRCIVDMPLLPFVAVSVPEDDRWLQRTARTRGREAPHVMQLLQQVIGRNATRTTIADRGTVAERITQRTHEPA